MFGMPLAKVLLDLALAAVVPLAFSAEASVLFLPRDGAGSIVSKWVPAPPALPAGAKAHVYVVNSTGETLTTIELSYKTDTSTFVGMRVIDDGAEQHASYQMDGLEEGCTEIVVVKLTAEVGGKTVCFAANEHVAVKGDLYIRLLAGGTVVYHDMGPLP